MKYAVYQHPFEITLDLRTCSLFSIGCFHAATTEQQIENREQVRRSNFN